MESLRKARDYYWDAFVTDKRQSWAVVQYLSLTLVMNHSPDFPDERQTQMPEETYDRPEKNLDALWSLAQLLSTYDVRSDDKERVSWAYGNLIELYLLSLIMPSRRNEQDAQHIQEAQRRALEYTNNLIDVAGRDAFEVYSTRRQVFRYISWFGKIATLSPALMALAEQIFAKFPEDIEEKWR